jgi:hypothetical protein
MSIITTPPSGPFGFPPLPVRRFTVAEYHRMIQTAVLTEDDPVELLEGWIVPKMPHNPPHDATVNITSDLLSEVLPAPWRVRVQSAVTTLDSEPEPDLAVVMGPQSRYRDRHPAAADIGLLIEVADSSLVGDRTVKLRLYARAGIMIYWIVNLIDLQIEVYTDPDATAKEPKYCSRQVYRSGDRAPVVLEGQQVGQIDVNDVMGLPGAG